MLSKTDGPPPVSETASAHTGNANKRPLFARDLRSSLAAAAVLSGGLIVGGPAPMLEPPQNGFVSDGTAALLAAAQIQARFNR
jgi:hypothetical protein